MDCEKFEPLLIDELYEELDELTSAAVKRHVSGCARCAGIMNGMRATRRLATLPMVELPDGLEDRIFAAAREAQKVVPIRSRFSRAMSVASSWAMRPQTAMAAVFLLMIGTSAFLFRSKDPARRESAVSVTVAGAPGQPVTAPAPAEAMDDKAAAAAHGPNVALPPAATASPVASAVALGDTAAGPLDKLVNGPNGTAREKSKEEQNALGGIFEGKQDKKFEDSAKDIASLDPTSAPTFAPPTNAGPPAGAPAYGEPYAQTPMLAPAAKPATGALSRRGGDDGQPQEPFQAGAAAFRARNYAEATRQFDVAAQSGDVNAALWAAESTKEGNGCAVALGRFDQVAQKAAGSWHGNEASLRAARCQIAMGQLDGARDRLNKLAQVPSHQAQAQQAINELNQVAARKSSGAAGAGGAAAGPQRSTAHPSPAPAKAPNAEMKSLDARQ